MSFHIRLFIWEEKHCGELMRKQADSLSFGSLNKTWPTDQTEQMKSTSISLVKEKECLAKLRNTIFTNKTTQN